jgi:hypothetical protein
MDSHQVKHLTSPRTSDGLRQGLVNALLLGNNFNQVLEGDVQFFQNETFTHLPTFVKGLAQTAQLHLHLEPQLPASCP